MGPARENLLSRIRERRIRAILSLAGREADAEGERLYLVGGCVRDILLGRRLGDLDLVVEGDPARLARRVADAAGGRSRGPTPFKTCRIEIPGGPGVDLAMSRREIYRAPAALPDVSAAGIEEDLRRRDFTVNSMAVGLSGSTRGRLLDPTGGRRDLERRLLRPHHPLSLVDDPTRAFRGARYAGRMALRPASGWEGAIRRAARERAFALLSSARLRREVELILMEKDPVPALKICGKWGLLRFLHPSLRWSPRIGSAFDRRRRLRNLDPANAAPLLLTLLTLRLSRDQRGALYRTLGLGAASVRRLSTAAAAPGRITRLIGSGWGSGGRPPFARVSSLAAEEELSLLVMRCTGDARVIRMMELALKLWRRSRPVASGIDLLRAGVPEGPRIGRILSGLRRARYEGRVRTAAAERDWIRAHS